MDGGVSGCMSGQMTGGWINGRTKESGRNGEFGERWGRGDLSGTYGSEADGAVHIRVTEQARRLRSLALLPLLRFSHEALCFQRPSFRVTSRSPHAQ